VKRVSFTSSDAAGALAGKTLAGCFAHVVLCQQNILLLEQEPVQGMQKLF